MPGNCPEVWWSLLSGVLTLLGNVLLSIAHARGYRIPLVSRVLDYLQSTAQSARTARSDRSLVIPLVRLALQHGGDPENVLKIISGILDQFEKRPSL